MARGLTQFAGTARMLWRLLESRGIDPGPIYAAAGVDVGTLESRGSRISVQQMDAVWRQTLTVIDDPCFALDVPRFWRLGDLHALDHAWFASVSLGAALSALVRYLEIVDQSGRLELERRAIGTALRARPPRAGLKDHAPLREGFLILVVHLARLVAGSQLCPLEVTLRSADTGCSDRYAAWFRCPVRFNSDYDSLLFDEQDLIRPLTAGNAEIEAAIQRVMTREVSRLRRGEGIVGQVTAALADALPAGEGSIEHIAAVLAISPRELQRRLQGAGTSFRAELDGTRKSLASQYLGDASLSLTEIAFLLGFSEQSAFSRACRRWFGGSPSELRAPASES